MTNRDFSVRSAQDEMRHFVGSSELDVIIVSDQDQNRGCKKNDKNHLKFLCKLCEASRRRAGRFFVHEQTSGVHSRMCV